jgi:hypothetical protein
LINPRCGKPIDIEPVWPKDKHAFAQTLECPHCEKLSTCGHHETPEYRGSSQAAPGFVELLSSSRHNPSPARGAFAASMRIAPTDRRIRGGDVGREKAEAEAAKIEITQRALRDSIEQSKRLAEEAEKLVQQHRQTQDNRTERPG